MSRKELIEKFKKVEEKYPVHSWAFGELEVWPVIKRVIFFDWYNNQKISNITPPSQNQLTGHFSLFQFRNIKKIARFLSELIKIRTCEVLYTGALPYRNEYDNEFVNRYFFQEISKNRKAKLFEYGVINHHQNYDLVNQTVFLQYVIPILSRLVTNKKKYDFIAPERESVFDELREFSTLSTQENIQRFRALFQVLYRKYLVFRRLLKLMKPKKVISLCYYNVEMLMLHAAANQLQIPNYDFQHGGQGELHCMYNFQPKCSKLNTIPMGFYCWDNVSASTILNWKSPENVKVVGNPWVEFQLEHDKGYSFPKEKKVILYTHQGGDLEDYIYESIANTRADFEWWIRIHPRRIEYKKIIHGQMQKRGVKHHVEFECSNQYPLPIILKHTSVHISKYSGSVIEAALIKTPSVIIDSVGVDIYKEYIKDGFAFPYLEKNSEELLNQIYSIADKQLIL